MGAHFLAGVEHVVGLGFVDGQAPVVIEASALEELSEGPGLAIGEVQRDRDRRVFHGGFPAPAQAAPARRDGRDRGHARPAVTLTKKKGRDQRPFFFGLAAHPRAQRGLGKVSLSGNWNPTPIVPIVRR